MGQLIFRFCAGGVRGIMHGSRHEALITTAGTAAAIRFPMRVRATERKPPLEKATGKRKDYP
jgi:hypothetical protein